MVKFNIPTSKDIYIEINGKKLAAVESFRAKVSRQSKFIEAFGESEPVGTIYGNKNYTLELSRIYIFSSGLSVGINFYDLDDFNLVIVKPDKKIIYSGCQWQSINEAAGTNEAILENVVILAKRRIEVQN